jgi:hypothetical protein
MMNDVKANEYQIGGKHYKVDYEHWDYVLDTRQGYLEGNATRYIVRWRKKNGIEDLRKALHYVNKLIEWAQRGHDRLDMSEYMRAEIGKCTHQFAQANGLGYLEQQVCYRIASWTRVDELLAARADITRMIDVAELNEPRLPIKEPEPVPLTEENHYAPRAGLMADLQEDEE